MIMPGTELSLPGTTDGAAGQLADASGAGSNVGFGEANATAAPSDQVAQAVPETNAPPSFGHPNGAISNPSHLSQPIAESPHLSQPAIASHPVETSMPPAAGAASAATVVGPGAAGAATLPTQAVSQVSTTAPANTPENASVVSSTISNDLVNFLSRKK